MSDIVALVLAAGRASRFGGPQTKVLAELNGEALVRHVCHAALAAGLKTFVVGGYQAAKVQAAIADLPVVFVENKRFAEGLSTSLQAGVAAAGDADGVLVMLADMPKVDAALIARLLAAFAENSEADAIVPNVNGERGNPVLLSKVMFGEVMQLKGDQGARKLIMASEAVVDVPVFGDAALLDIDTPDALDRL